MASAAGAGLMRFQIGFSVGLNIVHAVTVGAHRRHGDEPIFEQSFAMNTLLVFGVWLLDMYVVFQNHLHILMADGTGSRNVRPIYGRIRIGGCPYVMLSMTVGTSRDIRITPLNRSPTVDAGPVFWHGRKVRRALEIAPMVA